MGDQDYRVEVAYRFKRKKKAGKFDGVLLGMKLRAADEDGAIEQAIANHITPYPARVYIGATCQLYSDWDKP